MNVPVHTMPDHNTPAPTRAEVDALMRRCQIGVGGRNALDNAHSILAECYGTLGRQQIELERLRARVLELEAVHEDASGAVLQERARFATLMTDLRVLATCCMWPDGDGAPVNAQMWAEDWVRRLDGPNAPAHRPAGPVER
jgi:hypothetical protein